MDPSINEQFDFQQRYQDMVMGKDSFFQQKQRNRKTNQKKKKKQKKPTSPFISKCNILTKNVT